MQFIEQRVRRIYGSIYDASGASFAESMVYALIMDLTVRDLVV